MDRVAERLRKTDKFNAVYAYEDGALETFRAAKDLNISSIV